MTTELGDNPSLRSYGETLRRRKWWVIAFALAGLAVSVALSSAEPNQYSATAQVVVQAPTNSTGAGAAQQPVTATEVQTMVLLVTGAPVQNAVRHQLGSAPPVTASEVAQTNAIAVTAISRNPAEAAQIANAYARAFVSNQQQLELKNMAAAQGQLHQQLKNLAKEIKPLRGVPADAAQLSALVSQQVVLNEELAQLQVSEAGNAAAVVLESPAQIPTSPSSPKPVEDGLLGLAAGLILGIGAAFLRDNLDDALTSQEAAEHIGGAPVLAVVPMVPSWKRRDRPLVISMSNPTSPAAEAYRSLRTALQFARQENNLQTVVVTSPASEEGKTTTLANLGVAFAQARLRVVLVSCDLRRPRLGQFFGIDESIGLTSVILGHQRLEDVIQAAPGDGGLCVLGAGPLPPNPAELLGTQGAHEIFAALRGSFDLVLIDSPPVLPVTDGVVLSQMSDATLLVVAAGQTRRGELQRSVERLEQVNAPVVGLILNEVTRMRGANYGYQSGGYYGQAALSAGPALNGHAAHTSAGRRGRRRD
jgi:capsular exopolysaccharide synthesis family protein